MIWIFLGIHLLLVSIAAQLGTPPMQVKRARVPTERTLSAVVCIPDGLELVDLNSSIFSHSRTKPQAIITLKSWPEDSTGYPLALAIWAARVFENGLLLG